MNTMRGESNPVISAATGKEMLTPQIDTDDPAFAQERLGLFCAWDGR